MLSSSKNQITFKIATFSTNFDSYSPLYIIRPFLISSNCDNILFVKENIIEFEQKIPKYGISCKTTFVEIPDFDKRSDLSEWADAIVIFVDLECEISSVNLVNILNFISEKFSEDKTGEMKIHIISFYNNTGSFISSYNKESIMNLISENCDIYEFNQIDINMPNSIIRIYEKLTMESLKRKSENNNLGWKMEENMSESNCTIL